MYKVKSFQKLKIFVTKEYDEYTIFVFNERLTKILFQSQGVKTIEFGSPCYEVGLYDGKESRLCLNNPYAMEIVNREWGYRTIVMQCICNAWLGCEL